MLKYNFTSYFAFLPFGFCGKLFVELVSICRTARRCESILIEKKRVF